MLRTWGLPDPSCSYPSPAHLPTVTAKGQLGSPEVEEL